MMRLIGDNNFIAQFSHSFLPQNVNSNAIYQLMALVLTNEP